jgi:DNA-binding LacI/PurR family transcriptional regulator
MSRIRMLTAPEQVAAHLRGEILGGRWRLHMPGEDRLIAELGIGRHTAKTALKLLEDEGLLRNEGIGKQRRVLLPEGGIVRKGMRVRVLLYGREDVTSAYNADLIDQLHRAGMRASHAVKSLCDLGMNVGRVARFVAKTPTDAWVVVSGSREVLEWFAGQSIPSIAMFGRFTGLPIAATSPRIAPAMIKAVRQLVELGHRRIVMLAGEERRKPFPALLEQLFLKELAAQGITVGKYHLPDWDNHADGLRRCLDSMFLHTPPTAILCGETRIFVAAQQYLARRGIQAPEQVSLVCSDPDPSFAWCKPAVSHFYWDYKPVVRRIVRWAEKMAQGKEDKRQILFESEFVEGGTIGPP